MNKEWRNELITKGEAFDALTEIESHYEFEDGHDHLMRWAKTKIFALPSAQPQHKVRFSDADHVWIDGKQYISLKRFGEAVKDAQLRHYHEENLLTYAHDMGVTLEQAKKELTMITTAPEPHYDEWCDDCAEYDKENHCCPRFNHVIRTTIDDVRKDAMAQRWRLVAEQPPKEEEEVFVYLFDPPSPYIAWISKFDGKWHTEDFTLDEEDNPIAYMPLPMPYKPE